MTICWSCGEGTVVVDQDSGVTVCNGCGCEHDRDVFHNQVFDSDGRLLCSTHKVGHRHLDYRERITRNAKTLISDMAARLGLSPATAEEATDLASDATTSAFGAGVWFTHLAAACFLIVCRRRGLPITLPMIADAAGTDAASVARMADRVTRHLGIGALPGFDATKFLERTINTSPMFSSVDEFKLNILVSQGRFLMQCASKWFLVTGRHLLPITAAVIAFVVEVNKVEVGIEAIAKSLSANLRTSKLRFKELVDALVKVARNLLPWGSNVNSKNLSHHAYLLMKLMEMKAKSDPVPKEIEQKEMPCLNLERILEESAKEDEFYSKYFKQAHEDVAAPRRSVALLSGERLSHAYKSALERLVNLKESSQVKSGKTSRRGFDFDSWKDWDSGIELTQEQVLTRDVGLVMMPPSYTARLEACKHRRVKIEAAKVRINQIVDPVGSSKRKRSDEFPNLDWEDCILELLLLRGVNEEEIEQGQYTRLLDLHVFT